MKKAIILLLILTLALSLNACAFAFTHEVYTRPQETMSPETFTGDQVPPLEESPQTYLMEETVEDLVTGTVTRMEFIPGPAEFPAPIGLILYENDAEVRREDWVLDNRGNIIQKTVTVNGDVTEAWEYQLTYNANFDIDERISTLNGQWQKTEDFVYQTKEPYAIRSIYVTEEGNDDPPLYSFSYTLDGMPYDFSIIHAYESGGSGKNGYAVYNVTVSFDDQGKLENRRVSKKNEGFYDVYYEKFAYADNHTTISRYDASSHDQILRIEETYDDLGNLILSEEYDLENTLLRRTTRNYLTYEIG